jgi:hypothetical protein
MLFLVQYDRRAGRIVRLDRFSDDQRHLAAETGLNLEIELQRRRQSHEVVLLDAASEEALRKTHGRYFEDVEGLLAAMAQRFSEAQATRSRPKSLPPSGRAVQESGKIRPKINTSRP